MPKGYNYSERLIIGERILKKYSDCNNVMGSKCLAEKIDFYSCYGRRKKRQSYYSTMQSLFDYNPNVQYVLNKGIYYSRDYDIAQALLAESVVAQSRVIDSKNKMKLSTMLADNIGPSAMADLRGGVVYMDSKYETDKKISQYLETIREAISEHIMIKFQYADLNERFERVIKHGDDHWYYASPYILQFANGTCYIHASDYNEKKYKSFRVDRMMSVGRVFKYKWEDPRAYFGREWKKELNKKIRHTFDHFGDEKVEIKLQVKCNSVARNILYDMAGTDIRVISGVLGDVENVLIETYRGDTLTKFLYSNAMYFKVLSPRVVIDDLIELKREIEAETRYLDCDYEL